MEVFRFGAPETARWPETAIHGGLGGHFMEVWANSWRFGFMEVSRLGAPETAPPPGQAHTHSRLGFREPKRLKYFENYLRIQSQKTRWAT